MIGEPISLHLYSPSFRCTFFFGGWGEWISTFINKQTKYKKTPSTSLPNWLENKASQRPNHIAYKKKKKLYRQLAAQKNIHHKSLYRGLANHKTKPEEQTTKEICSKLNNKQICRQIPKRTKHKVLPSFLEYSFPNYSGSNFPHNLLQNILLSDGMTCMLEFISSTPNIINSRPQN